MTCLPIDVLYLTCMEFLQIKITGVVGFIFEGICTYFLIARTKTDGKRTSIPLTILFVMMLMLLYLTKYDYFLDSFTRVPYRVMCYMGILRFYKGTSIKTSTFYALFLTAVYTTYVGIRTVPVFQLYQQNFINCFSNILPSSIDLSTLFSFVKNLIFILIVAIVYFSYPYEKIANLQFSEIFILVVAVFCDAFIKESLLTIYLNTNTVSSEQITTYSIYIILLLVFLLAFLIIFERNFCSNKEKKNMELQEISNKYVLKALQQYKNSNEEYRVLNHDIKNHLIAIDDLLSSNQIDEAKEYISSLIGTYQKNKIGFFTGDDLIDGLLTMKYETAKQYDIKFEIAANLANIVDISSIDKCTIFGNALDNAIEANASKDIDNKFIQIKSRKASNLVIITISNSFDGNIHQVDKKFLSTKNNPTMHGIGISNIEKAVNKYGGEITVILDRPYIFDLIITLPCKEENS